MPIMTGSWRKSNTGDPRCRLAVASIRPFAGDCWNSRWPACCNHRLWHQRRKVVVLPDSRQGQAVGTLAARAFLRNTKGGSATVKSWSSPGSGVGFCRFGTVPNACLESIAMTRELPARGSRQLGGARKTEHGPHYA
jgi:hypothetical protein